MDATPVNTDSSIPPALKRLTIICCILVVSDIMLACTVGYLVYQNITETSLTHMESQNNESIYKKRQLTNDGMDNMRETIDSDLVDIREKICRLDITIDNMDTIREMADDDIEEMREMIHHLHIAFDNKTIMQEVIEDDMDKLRERIHHLDISVENMDKMREMTDDDIEELRERIHQFNMSVNSINITVDDIQKEWNNVSENHRKIADGISTHGTSYVRWGKTACPENSSEEIYNGFVGGATLRRESGTSVICMPKDPEWNKYDDSLFSENIVGAEYYTDEVFAGNHKYYNVPCAVCNVITRSSMIMIPAKRNCYTGWTLEYSGYLMVSMESSDFVCVDEEPENIPGSETPDHSLDLILVEIRCKSLECPPYVENRQLTCVVCTK